MNDKIKKDEIANGGGSIPSKKGDKPVKKNNIKYIAIGVLVVVVILIIILA